MCRVKRIYRTGGPAAFCWAVLGAPYMAWAESTAFALASLAVGDVDAGPTPGVTLWAVLGPSATLVETVLLVSGARRLEGNGR